MRNELLLKKRGSFVAEAQNCVGNAFADALGGISTPRRSFGEPSFNQLGANLERLQKCALHLEARKRD